MPTAQRENDQLREVWEKFERERNDQLKSIQKQEEREAPVKRPSRSARKGSKLFENMVSSDDDSKAEDTEALYRVRFLSEECFDAIKLAYSFSKDFSLATCYWEGFSSPSCIKQLAAERSFIERYQKAQAAKSGNKTQTKKPTKDALATF